MSEERQEKTVALIGKRYPWVEIQVPGDSNFENEEIRGYVISEEEFDWLMAHIPKA